ncbi:MAG: hypothetical protein WCV79_04135 [Candidatus Paceibacterota bacterium]|jgi:hypothetical protein
MSRLSRVTCSCNGQEHHISAWEPGDEATCGYEHAIIGRKGYILCLEDHDELELDMTIVDLTGESTGCLKQIDLYNKNHPYHFLIEGGMINSICAGSNLNDENGQYALWKAAEKGYIGVIDLMIKIGVSVSDDIEYMVYLATEFGQQLMVPHLLQLPEFGKLSHSTKLSILTEASIKAKDYNYHRLQELLLKALNQLSGPRG